MGEVRSFPQERRAQDIWVNRGSGDEKASGQKERHRQEKIQARRGFKEKKFPFSIEASKIDGCLKIKGQLEEAGLSKKILLFKLPMSFPKLNGRVERTNRTYREEFYEVDAFDLNLEDHNRQLEEVAYSYNYLRPYPSLELAEFLSILSVMEKNQKTHGSLRS